MKQLKNIFQAITRQTLCFLLILSLVEGLPLQSTAQLDTTKGIKWTTGLSWEQIKAKAKTEKKYIFVDCYTTWCLPCKNMDVYIYPQEKIGNYFNERFVSVKVQMDKTAKDDTSIQSWYTDAKNIENEFGVNAFPTFLFFSPDGKPLHKAAGGYNVDGLIALAKNAFDPSKQYYKMLSDYRSGSMSPAEMKQKARSLKLSGKELAEIIAIDYLDGLDKQQALSADDLKFITEFKSNQQVLDFAINYFRKLSVIDLKSQDIKEFVKTFSREPDAKKIALEYIGSLKKMQLFETDNVAFVRAFAQSSKDPFFVFLHKHANEIESKIGYDYVKGHLTAIIKKEVVDPAFTKAIDENSKIINWQKLEKRIRKSFGSNYSSRVILDSKVFWFHMKKNYVQYTKILIERLDMQAPHVIEDTTAQGDFGAVDQINDPCWFVFQFSNNKDELNRAIYWMEQLFLKRKIYANWPLTMDTYANLLYKIGRTSEALSLEEKALKIDPYYQDAKDAYAKMKAGLPTWPLVRE